METKVQPKLSDYISEEEREHLLSSLHRFLIWIGEPLPNSIEMNGETVELHELIWRCIHKKEFTEQEKARFTKLINLLKMKEEHDTEILQKTNLTHEEAKKLYHEISALARAIMDIRECETGKVMLKEYNKDIEKVEDTKRWVSFLKNVGRKID